MQSAATSVYSPQPTGKPVRKPRSRRSVTPTGTSTLNMNLDYYPLDWGQSEHNLFPGSGKDNHEHFNDDHLREFIDAYSLIRSTEDFRLRRNVPVGSVFDEFSDPTRPLPSRWSVFEDDEFIDSALSTDASLLHWIRQASLNDGRYETQQEIESRLRDLRAFSIDDEIPWSEKSEWGLKMFLEQYRPTKRPVIVHLDNGNLRAIWKGPDEQHVGLQFLGPNDVQYILFTRRPGAHFVTQKASRDTLEGTIADLKSLGLYELVVS